jgi:hypothetical protein
MVLSIGFGSARGIEKSATTCFPRKSWWFGSPSCFAALLAVFLSGQAYSEDVLISQETSESYCYLSSYEEKAWADCTSTGAQILLENEMIKELKNPSWDNQELTTFEIVPSGSDISKTQSIIDRFVQSIVVCESIQKCGDSTQLEPIHVVELCSSGATLSEAKIPSDMFELTLSTFSLGNVITCRSDDGILVIFESRAIASAKLGLSPNSPGKRLEVFEFAVFDGKSDE